MTWYVLRAMRETDVPFIAQTWLNSYAKAHPATKSLRSDYLETRNRRLGASLKHAYYVDHSARVNEWLRHGLVRVAVLEADDDVIVGWACGERHVSGDVAALHYSYVKSAYRGQGVAGALWDDLAAKLVARDVVCTHITPMAARSSRVRSWPHVPWLAFRHEEKHGTGARRLSA